MKGLSVEQKRTIADFMSNVGVVWAGGGIISPILSGQGASPTPALVVWSFFLAILSLGIGVWVGRK